jgi:Family of unknown function (DUF5677)
LHALADGCSNMADMENDKEALSLELVCDIQAQLSKALKPLEGKEWDRLLERFLFHQAVHINRATAGYVFLRKASMVDASKLLIRPSIEAMIRILAVRKDRSLLYRMAYTERMDDKRFLRPSWLRAGKEKDYDADDQRRWNDFKQKYAAEFPEHRLIETQLPLRNAAEAGGIQRYYDTYYRLYCQFTHAAFRAVTGGLNHTGTEDNETVAACAYSGLEAAASVGAEAPNLVSLGNRLMHLDKGESTKQGTEGANSPT